MTGTLFFSANHQPGRVKMMQINDLVNSILLLAGLSLEYLMTIIVSFVVVICWGKIISPARDALMYLMCSFGIGILGAVGSSPKLILPHWEKILAYFSAAAGLGGAAVAAAFYIYFCIRDFPDWSGKKSSAPNARY
jgi:hypothetical protein